MQKVAGPRMIVVSEKLTPLKLMNEFSAMPVMIPGSAIGSTNRNEIDSRPKKRKRWTANAAIEPSSTAIAVESSPARTDSHSAWRISALCQVEENHFVDRPCRGQLCTLDGLNAYTRMIAMGKNRNSKINAVHTANARRLKRSVPITALRTLPSVVPAAGTGP